MTKHERLTYLLTAAAKAVHLSTDIENDPSNMGAWDGKEEPAIRWYGLLFTPVDVVGHVYHGVQKKEVKVPGWELSYEIYYHGTQWEAPEIEVEEVVRDAREWAVVQAAVLHVIQEHVGYALGEADEALLIKESQKEEETL